MMAPERFYCRSGRKRPLASPDLAPFMEVEEVNPQQSRLVT